jgi:PAS domain S-box-containing protein
VKSPAQVKATFLAERAESGDPPACAGSVADGLVELDRAGKLVAVDRRVLEIFGVDGAEVDEIQRVADAAERQRRLIAALTARASDPTLFGAGIQRQMATPDEITFEDIHLRDGRVVERYGMPVRSPDGALVGRRITLRDVTARRRGEIELRERARQQEAVATLGEIALNCEDLDSLLLMAIRLVAETIGGTYVHLLEVSADGSLLVPRHESARGGGPSPSALGVPGRSPAALALATGATVVASDVARDRRCAGFPADGTSSVASAVVRGRTRAFGVLCVHWSGTGTPAPDAVHFVETVANILAAAIARREAERALAARERELRAVFDATQEALLTSDDAGRLTAANDAARRLFGRPLDELIGREVFTLCGCEGPAHDRWTQLQSEGRAAGTVEVPLAGGGSRTVDWNAVARILPGRHLFALRDVTEQRVMQARLGLADRMASLGTLSAGIAHELRTPLAYVSANIEFALDELGKLGPSAAPGALEETGAALRDATEGTERMRRILSDLRIFSRPDDSRDGPVRVQPIVESTLNLASNEIKQRARVVRDLAPVPEVRGNEARLGQVFLNVIVNAAQAIPKGAPDRNTITVRTRLEPNGRVAVEVRDTGCGIAPENLSRVFDPFFTTKPPSEGTGLGLSICRQIVSDLGGSIEVDSAPGRGTTVVVTLCAA